VDLAALRALPDDELIRRHDAAADRDGAPMRSTVYFDVLRARVAEQQTREILRALYAILLVLGLLLAVVIATMIVVA
jgi:hypothetical protein